MCVCLCVCVCICVCVVCARACVCVCVCANIGRYRVPFAAAGPTVMYAHHNDPADAAADIYEPQAPPTGTVSTRMLSPLGILWKFLEHLPEKLVFFQHEISMWKNTNLSAKCSRNFQKIPVSLFLGSVTSRVMCMLRNDRASTFLLYHLTVPNTVLHTVRMLFTMVFAAAFTATFTTASLRTRGTNTSFAASHQPLLHVSHARTTRHCIDTSALRYGPLILSLPLLNPFLLVPILWLNRCWPCMCCDAF